VKTGLRYRTAGIVGVAAIGVLVALAACSNQSEGDRCDFDNGNDDCGNGLVCVPKANQTGRSSNGVVNPPFNNADRCCPLDRNTATHPACTQNTSSTATDAAVPGDTGPLPDVAVDAPADVADTGTDSPADAADGG
jgi:hypothetical protein